MKLMILFRKERVNVWIHMFKDVQIDRKCHVSSCEKLLLWILFTLA